MFTLTQRRLEAIRPDLDRHVDELRHTGVVDCRRLEFELRIRLDTDFRGVTAAMLDLITMRAYRRLAAYYMQFGNGPNPCRDFLETLAAYYGVADYHSPECDDMRYWRWGPFPSMKHAAWALAESLPALKPPRLARSVHRKRHGRFDDSPYVLGVGINTLELDQCEQVDAYLDRNVERIDDLLHLLSAESAAPEPKWDDIRARYTALRARLRDDSRELRRLMDEGHSSETVLCFLFPAVQRAVLHCKPAADADPIDSAWSIALIEVRDDLEQYLDLLRARSRQAPPVTQE